MWSKWAFAIVLVALSAAGFVGCGDDDEENQNPGQAALASCNSLCDKQGAAMCGLAGETCKQLCSTANGASQCAARFKAYYDCQHALADVCNLTSCQNQFVTALQCLAPDAGGPG